MDLRAVCVPSCLSIVVQMMDGRKVAPLRCLQSLGVGGMVWDGVGWCGTVWDGVGVSESSCGRFLRASYCPMCVADS